MGRLSIVVLFTPELARQQEFYEKSLGLSAASAAARWVQFGTRDAALALRPLASGETPRTSWASTPSLNDRLAVLKSRGVEPVGELESLRTAGSRASRTPKATSSSWSSAGSPPAPAAGAARTRS
jgi:hypothetical protein